MRKFYYLLLIVCGTNLLAAQKISIVSIQQLQARIKANNDTTFIINFWATWCAPCVTELPDLDSISKKYSNQSVKVLLVSLDFVEDINTKVIPFLKKKQLISEVLLLNETNANNFIPTIDNAWTGAIPATLIINTTKKVNTFYEQKITYELLKKQLEVLKIKP